MTEKELVNFHWFVARDGYYWIEANNVLVPRQEEWHGEGGRYYNPLLEARLYKTFSKTEPTPDGILRFANRYGLLGDPYRQDIWMSQGNRNYQLFGVSFKDWADEIRDIRIAVELWEMLNLDPPDLMGLERRIRWTRDANAETDQVDYLKNDKLYESIFLRYHYSREPESPETAGIDFGDIERPAWLMIRSYINRHMKGKISPRAQWNEDKKGLYLQLEPSSLIGAIWLQFMQAVTNAVSLQRCATCGDLYAIEKGDNPNRRYCSDSCKQKAFRQRHQIAR